MTTAAANFSLLGKRFQIAYRDTDGYPIGVQEDGTIVAADDAAIGETYNAVTVNGFVSFTAPVKEVEYATDQSDGTNKGKIPMGINDYGTGEIELSEEDELALNMIKNVSTDTTLNTSWRVTSGNDTSITSPSMIIMFSVLVRNQINGAARYKNLIYHNATITVTTPAGAGQTGGTNPNNQTWSYDVAPSDRASALGYLFSDTTLDVEEDNDTYSIVWSDNPLSFTTYIGDGTTGTWETLYKPLYNNITGDVRNTITKEGVKYPVTSYSVTTAVITPAASVTSGHRVVTLYETAYRLP
jgi:hypothetical protein